MEERLYHGGEKPGRGLGSSVMTWGKLLNLWGACFIIYKRGIMISTFLGHRATLSVQKLVQLWKSRKDFRAQGYLQGCCHRVTWPCGVLLPCVRHPVHPLHNISFSVFLPWGPRLVSSCGGRPEVVVLLSAGVFSHLPRCVLRTSAACSLTHRAELPFTLSVGCSCYSFLFWQRLPSHGCPE